MAEDTTSVHWRFNDKDVIHPAKVKQYADKWGTPQEFWGKANSYTNPLGKEPGNLWLLMRRKDVYEMDATGTYSLTIVDTPNDQTVTAPGFSIVKAYSVVLAEAETDDAVYLVHAQDARGDMAYSSINKQYNVRQPAPKAFSGATLYYPESLNSGSIWTWETMFGDIWTNLPDSAGSAPTLPYTPHGTPEGFRFIGVSAWDALHVVLEKIGCTTVYSATGGAITVVRLGTTDQTLTTTFEDLKPRLMYEGDPLAGFFASSMPETIEVFFRRKDEYYGTESDTPRTGNWEMTPAYSKTVATGVDGAAAGSIFPVWDDLPALWSSTSGTWSNSATMDARAAEVASNIEDRIRREQERLARIYSGIVTSVPPSPEVSEVKWRHYGDSRAGTEVGTVTEIRNRPPEPPMPVAMRRGMSFSEIEATTTENLLPPDFSRGTHPVYPRVSQMVKVVNTGSPAGYTVSANGNGLHPGKVYVIKGTTMTVQEDCWILFIDQFDSKAGAVSVVNHDYYIGRLYGAYSSGGTVYPLYTARSGSIQENIGYLFELTATLSLGGSAAAETLNCSYTKTGIPITVHDFESENSGPSGYKGACLYQPTCNTFEIIAMQRRARFIYATMQSVIAGGGTATATVTQYWDGQDPGSTVTVRNLTMVTTTNEIEENDQVLCCWKDTVSQPTGEYVIIEKFEGYRWAKVTSSAGAQVGLAKPWPCNAVDNLDGTGVDAPAIAITVWVRTTFTPVVDNVIPYKVAEDGRFVCPWDGGGGIRINDTCTLTNYTYTDGDAADVRRLELSKHWGWILKEHSTDSTRALFDWQYPQDARSATVPRNYAFASIDPNDAAATWPVWNTWFPIFSGVWATGQTDWTTKDASWGGFVCASSGGLTRTSAGVSQSSNTQIGRVRLSSGLIGGTPGRDVDVLWSDEVYGDPVTYAVVQTGCSPVVRSSNYPDGATSDAVYEIQFTKNPGIYNVHNPLVIKHTPNGTNTGTITLGIEDGHLYSISTSGTFTKDSGVSDPRMVVSGAIHYDPPADTYDYCP